MILTEFFEASIIISLLTSGASEMQRVTDLLEGRELVCREARFQSKLLVTKPCSLPTLPFRQPLLEESSNPVLRLYSVGVESVDSGDFLGSELGSAT